MASRRNLVKGRNAVLVDAGGRDFHNFNVLFRNNPDYKVVAFTAIQIPFTEKRKYPASLSGPLYPKWIPVSARRSFQS